MIRCLLKCTLMEVAVSRMEPAAKHVLPQGPRPWPVARRMGLPRGPSALHAFYQSPTTPARVVCCALGSHQVWARQVGGLVVDCSIIVGATLLAGAMEGVMRRWPPPARRL